MKISLIRTCLMVGSILIMGVVANAQVSQQYRAEVPVDFHANGKAYAAGDYSIGPLGTHSSQGALALLEKKTGKMRIIGLASASLGVGPSEEKGKLVFLKSGDRYTLSEVITPTFGMKMKRTTTDVRIAKNRAAKPETAAINLH